MSGPVLCLCGADLLDEIDEKGFVRAAGMDAKIPFRRHSDHIVCPACMRSYHARDLIDLSSDPAVIETLNEIVKRARDRRRRAD